MPNPDFLEAVAEIVSEIAGAPLDDDPEARLNRRFQAGGEQFARLSALCAKGEAEGWLMARSRRHQVRTGCQARARIRPVQR